MVLDCHFNLLEPIWMHKILAWSFVFITLRGNEKQAVCACFWARVRVHAPIVLRIFLVA
jgi:hypothetical protein